MMIRVPKTKKCVYINVYSIPFTVTAHHSREAARAAVQPKHDSTWLGIATLEIDVYE